MKRVSTSHIALLVMTCLACPPPVWAEKPSPPEPAQAAVATAKRVASKLKKSLLTRVKRAIKEDGAPAAIQVCSQQAPELTAEVARKHNVTLGRTSTRLRNPQNAAPEWMKPVLAKQASLKGPQVVPLPNGHGVAIPIKTFKSCLLCHGKQADMDPKLRAKLAEVYPEDAAIGFARGDLRGWFWVEVPAQER